MDAALRSKVKTTIRELREAWRRSEGLHRFVAFSTGKDSLAVAALLYEAVEPERPPCLFVQHDLQFPTDEDYLASLRDCGFAIEVLRPFLEYFELLERGIGFPTKTEAWCIPLLIGTGFLEWLQQRGAPSPRSAVMFRGISGSEWSRRYHAKLELYERLDLPCVNPLLGFSSGEIVSVLTGRYGLPLNPIYRHLKRTYCICCYAPDKRRQAFSEEHFPTTCRRFYGHIERCLFESGLIGAAHLPEKYRTSSHQLQQHGFMHWRRSPSQDRVGAVRRRLRSGALAYAIRHHQHLDLKHLRPLAGSWTASRNEIRFWDTPERAADAVVKRMLNCLDCGFCSVQCLRCRRFDRQERALVIEGCLRCGKCLDLKFCMGWRHRFWRRVIVEAA